MRQFTQTIDNLPVGWVDEVLAYRQWLAIHGPANICTPARPEVERYSPFDRNDYPHCKEINYMDGPEWFKLKHTKPDELVTHNPFEPSQVRPGGFKVWDGAIAVPASKVRDAKPILLSKALALRNCNSYWRDIGEPAMSRCGFIGKGGTLIRPSGDYIYDLKAMANGWQLLQLAYQLCILRGYWQVTDPDFRVDAPRIAYRFPAALAEIAVALAFDIPLDIGERLDNKPSRPDFQYYGLDVRSTTRLAQPGLCIPQIAKEALLPDETLAVIATSVHIEPPPTGFVDGTMKSSDEDRWCNMPTMVAIAGWEMVDVIAHAQEVYRNPDDLHTQQKAPSYGIRVEDLMPPHYLWAYLAKAREMYGEPEEAIARLAKKEERPEIVDDYMYVQDYLNSDLFIRRYFQTPPLLRQNCMLWNKEADGIPIPPGHYKPKRADMKTFPQWVKYNNDEKRALNLINTAIVRYEGKLYGKRLAKRIRRAQVHGHKQVFRSRLNKMRLKELEAKYKEKGSLTSKEEDVYKRLKILE